MVKKIIKAVLGRFGFKLERICSEISVDLFSCYFGLISAKLSYQKILTIQVGANDGKTNDPIFHAAKKFSDKIILIEPQIELHDILAQNYSDFKGELKILESLVSPVNDKVKLYKLSELAHTEYFNKSKSNPTGIASVKRSHLEKMLTKNGFPPKKHEKFIVSKEINTLRLSDIINEQATDDIIFLQVDCEGADWTVIKTLGHVLPNLINFEKKHLSNEDLQEADFWFKSQGYITHDYRGDCLAVKMN